MTVIVTVPLTPSGEVAVMVTGEVLLLTAVSVTVLPGPTVTGPAKPLIVTVVGSDVLQVTARPLVTSLPKLSVSVAIAVALWGSRIPVALIAFDGSEVDTPTVATCPITTTVA
jgi:hypothetical protein